MVVQEVSSEEKAITGQGEAPEWGEHAHRSQRELARPQANPVWLRLVREWHEEAAKHLSAHAARPFAAAQGDTVRYRRVMLIGRPSGETGRG
jgi:hypothetical protein